MNKIKKFREEKGWTQEELAKQTGLSRVTISQLENGSKEDIKLTTMQALSKALGVSMEEIFLTN